MTRFVRNAFIVIGLAAWTASAPLAAQEIIDILLKNGHVIAPHNERNGRFDIAIKGEKIHRVGKDLSASHAKKVIDLGEY